MAREDAGKWVARAGATGGGRTYRARVPYRWYLGLVLIVILGVFLVAYSRYERLHPVTAAVVGPTTSDHWVAGLVFDVCGTAQQTLAASPVQQSLTAGFYSSGDGVIQIQPKSSADTGANATLGRFTSQYAGMKLTATSLGLPKKPVYTDGEKCPAGTPDAGKTGELVAKILPSATAPTSSTQTQNGDLRTVRFSQTLELITVAFVPNGATVPRPDGAVVTAVLNAQNATTATTTATTAPPITSTTQPPTTTTTAKGTTTTTAANSTTTTAKGSTTTTTG